MNLKMKIYTKKVMVLSTDGKYKPRGVNLMSAVKSSRNSRWEYQKSDSWLHAGEAYFSWGEIVNRDVSLTWLMTLVYIVNYEALCLFTLSWQNKWIINEAHVSDPLQFNGNEDARCNQKNFQVNVVYCLNHGKIYLQQRSVFAILFKSTLSGVLQFKKLLIKVDNQSNRYNKSW